MQCELEMVLFKLKKMHSQEGEKTTFKTWVIMLATISSKLTR
jgi:hypothetical protein